MKLFVVGKSFHTPLSLDTTSIRNRSKVKGHSFYSFLPSPLKVSAENGKRR
ncbi:uncharacterized protein HKW66_Vig0179230 [Vigna angularis]|uniref:Uncharacterized protein n=1 Tax=Phaseolus angularis TaxID=3914 RepID=A0A8T0JYH3_PHAAN|nr:uncharacterized protein HKW66_Vig0179230 [Vigna angularis]